MSCVLNLKLAPWACYFSAHPSSSRMHTTRSRVSRSLPHRSPVHHCVHGLPLSIAHHRITCCGSLVASMSVDCRRPKHHLHPSLPPLESPCKVVAGSIWLVNRRRWGEGKRRTKRRWVDREGGERGSEDMPTWIRGERKKGRLGRQGRERTCLGQNPI
jgi:hypothetical protein